MSAPVYKKKDFMADQLVRWCPGCGDYSILSQVQTVLSKLGRPKEEFVVISGIGCSSRFPYYMDTYGFHTLHGRAPAVASGLKVTRPELSVWMVTGDGDALSIGGNHIIHLLRRNIDLNVLLFNNRIYGLTKGQYSPTSEQGKVTKSSPMGSLEVPFNPLSLALGSGGSFIARGIDVFGKHLREMMMASDAHKGTSFLEIYQNCLIFNDHAFGSFTDREVRDEKILYLEEGQPLIWGKEVRRGLVLDGLALKVVEVTDEAQILVHDPRSKALAHLLVELDGTGETPVPVGIFYREDRSTYGELFQAQIAESRQTLGNGELADLIDSSDSWTV